MTCGVAKSRVDSKDVANKGVKVSGRDSQLTC